MAGWKDLVLHYGYEAGLQILTLDVIKSSEIEGEILDVNQVRSSIARRLGLDIAGIVPVDRNVEGVVEMMLDATQNFNIPFDERKSVQMACRHVSNRTKRTDENCRWRLEGKC